MQLAKSDLNQLLPHKQRNIISTVNAITKLDLVHKLNIRLARYKTSMKIQQSPDTKKMSLQTQGKLLHDSNAKCTAS